jgi:hypothetical protein
MHWSGVQLSTVHGSWSGVQLSTVHGSWSGVCSSVQCMAAQKLLESCVRIDILVWLGQ